MPFDFDLHHFLRTDVLIGELDLQHIPVLIDSYGPADEDPASFEIDVRPESHAGQGEDAEGQIEDLEGRAERGCFKIDLHHEQDRRDEEEDGAR
jgi:hypothetical protein